MTITAKAPDRRVQFDLVPERIRELDELMVLCDLRTRKDLFDNAMSLFEWAVHEVRSGNEVASYNRTADHVEVVRLPVLENAARKAKSHRQIELVDTSRAETQDQPNETQGRRNKLATAVGR
jgi:hypothetical protein